jgi:hypothetical protein
VLHRCRAELSPLAARCVLAELLVKKSSKRLGRRNDSLHLKGLVPFHAVDEFAERFPFRVLDRLESGPLIAADVDV